MLKALRDFSRVFCYKNLGVNGCTIDESNRPELESLLCSSIKYSSKKRIEDKDYVSRKFQQHYKKSWSENDWSYCRTKHFFEAFGWGSVFVLGYQFVIPKIRNHIRSISQTVKDGSVPTCSFNLQFDSLFGPLQKIESSILKNESLLLSVLPKNNQSSIKTPASSKNTKIFNSSWICPENGGDYKFPAHNKVEEAPKCKKVFNENTLLRRHSSEPNLSRYASLNNEHKVEDQFLSEFNKFSESLLSNLRNSIGIKTAEVDMKEAFKCFKLASFSSNAQSLFNLGVCYEKGLGTPKNLTEALKCYRRAESMGHKNATFNLAVLLIANKETFDEGVIFITKAANFGLKEAQCYLAVYLYEREDYSQAFSWFKSAASQGDADAMFNLGVCYDEGFGTDVNVESSYKYYKMAAEHGSEDAIEILETFNIESEFSNDDTSDDESTPSDLRANSSSPELSKLCNTNMYMDYSSESNVTTSNELEFTNKFWIGESDKNLTTFSNFPLVT